MKKGVTFPDALSTEKKVVSVARKDLPALFDSMRTNGFQILGPTLGEGAIVYDELSGIDDLPKGWTDEQDGATYRLKKRNDEALFGYNVGPHAWKKFLFPPRHRLWSAEVSANGLKITEEKQVTQKFAFIGVRACELKAILIQDKVFLRGEHVDPVYQARREDALLIAVNCTQAGKTCFCLSMDAGPRAESGFDLCLTEVLKEGEHYFIVEIGSEQGAEIMVNVPHSNETSEAEKTIQTIAAETAEQMGRVMDTENIQSLLQDNFDHPRWDDVASRCLTCANCTMACPTCFCSTVEDVTDITGDHAERWRQWDSCFTMDFTYMNHGHARASAKSRYRQWMTHKLSAWFDQFGTSGCVGCGRCITWCPVAIDITEEVNAIRESQTEAKPTSS
jgi:ferredoxin